MNRLPPLSFQKYRFMLEVTSPTLLPPYKGSTFRGGILTAFKRSVCVVPHGNCDICSLTQNCSYYSLFEPHRLKSGRGVPMPYIIEPPMTECRVFDNGDSLEFDVILIGKAASYWKLLVFAVKRLGETSGIGQQIDGMRGQYVVKEVTALTLEGEFIPVYSEAQRFHHLKTAQPEPLTAEAFTQSVDADSISTQAILKFLTPVRFIANSQEDSVSHKTLVKQLDFAFFMRQLLRRFSDLSEAHCDGGRFDGNALRELTAEVQMEKRVLYWKDWERYSRRHQSRMKLGGLIGTLKLTGNITPFLPYLRLGEWLHLGKQTSFGLGRYQLRLT